MADGLGWLDGLLGVCIRSMKLIFYFLIRNRLFIGEKNIHIDSVGIQVPPEYKIVSVPQPRSGRISYSIPVPELPRNATPVAFSQPLQCRPFFSAGPCEVFSHPR
jgi:hypothetical protein